MTAGCGLPDGGQMGVKKVPIGDEWMVVHHFEFFRLTI
jgi:hypothetical protein